MELRDLTLQPKNPVASFVDQYGEVQVIHRSKGKRLSVFKGGDTPALLMNRAASVLIGKKIKAKRIELGFSQRALCVRAGLANVNPKQYIHAIENASRLAGCKTGTLFAIAYALNCEVADLLPNVSEVVEYAGLKNRKVNALA